MHLSKNETDCLRVDLIEKLPGDWDLSTLSGVILLGEVGNESTISKLEALDKMPYESTGKFHVVITDAILRIKSRDGQAK